MNNRPFTKGGTIKLSSIDYSKHDLDTIFRFLTDVSHGLIELETILKQKANEDFEVWAENYLGE